MPARTLYDILEVSTTASPSVIKAAYDRLSKQLDDAPDSDSGIRRAVVKHAFLTLGNPEKRKVYDDRIAARPSERTEPSDMLDAGERRALEENLKSAQASLAAWQGLRSRARDDEYARRCAERVKECEKQISHISAVLNGERAQ